MFFVCLFSRGHKVSDQELPKRQRQKGNIKHAEVNTNVKRIGLLQDVSVAILSFYFVVKHCSNCCWRGSLKVASVHTYSHTDRLHVLD